jgi:integrase
MAEGAVYDKVRAVTLREIGIPFNLHSARHAVATQVAITCPENVGIVTPLLDHADPRTAEEAYNLSDSLSATADYQESMQVLRRRLVGTK